MPNTVPLSITIDRREQAPFLFQCHAYCRHGCALCWMEAAEKAAEKAADAEPVPKRRRGWNGQGRI